VPFSRPLRYRNETIQLPTARSTRPLVGHEKGIDVRIALDIVRQAIDGTYDVALLFSQDQDLSEVVDEIKLIAKQENRWIRVACAFPESPAAEAARRQRRGLDPDRSRSLRHLPRSQRLQAEDARPLNLH